MDKSRHLFDQFEAVLSDISSDSQSGVVSRLLTPEELESVGGADGTGYCQTIGGGGYQQSGGGTFTQSGGSYTQSGGSYGMSCP